MGGHYIYGNSQQVAGKEIVNCPQLRSPTLTLLHIYGNSRQATEKR